MSTIVVERRRRAAPAVLGPHVAAGRWSPRGGASSPSSSARSWSCRRCLEQLGRRRLLGSPSRAPPSGHETSSRSVLRHLVDERRRRRSYFFGPRPGPRMSDAAHRHDLSLGDVGSSRDAMSALGSRSATRWRRTSAVEGGAASQKLTSPRRQTSRASTSFAAMASTSRWALRSRCSTSTSSRRRWLRIFHEMTIRRRRAPPRSS